MPKALARSLLHRVYESGATRYDLQHALVTLNADRRGRNLVVAQGVVEGDTVLDAGGGTGGTALLAARRAGPKGRVAVLDFSPAMLAVARKKARRAGLEEKMDFQIGDMLRLPFADASFNAVLSTYSMCPLYDPVAGVLELYRVLKPGGRLAAAHSTQPHHPWVRRLAAWVEGRVWRFPSLSMGCRPVETLPALKQAGAEVVFETNLGFPLWPFLCYAVRKPGKGVVGV